ncbi:MAG: hypothetical protein Tsb0034_12420 [Ekhidna sp.]
MNNQSLSKEAIRLLEDNGYRVRISDKEIVFKKPYDYIGPIIILLIFGFIALPLFAYSYWLGALLLILVLLGIYFHRTLISKASKMKIFPARKHIDIYQRSGKRWFSFNYIEHAFLHSKFQAEYSSAFKSTSQEFKIVIGLKLLSGETIEVFAFLSDYEEPNKEINEVHDFLLSVLKKD